MRVREWAWAWAWDRVRVSGERARHTKFAAFPSIGRPKCLNWLFEKRGNEGLILLGLLFGVVLRMLSSSDEVEDKTEEVLSVSL